MSTAETWPTSTFILPYPQQFNVLPSAVRTPDFHFQKWHTALLTNVCEHPESINTMHSCPSTCTFMEGSFLVFSRLRRSLMLIPPPLLRFSGTAMLYVQGHCIWSNVSHDEPCASNYPASLGDPASSPLPCGWDYHTCSRQILPSLRTFDSEGVRLAEAAANSAWPSLSVMTALVQVNSCSTLNFHHVVDL